MITIPSMPTQYRPLPELELDLSVPQLRELAYTLDRVKVNSRWQAGLCFAIISTKASVAAKQAFIQAVSRGMNKDTGELDRHYGHLYQYLGDVKLKELTAIRQAWAAHIARSIYEQIGA